ncbi:MAG: helix-turn-helix domain-containing protein [Spirochaetia bacterium]
MNRGLMGTLKWIAQLLWRMRFSVDVIACKAGYEDSLYLSAQFKKHFGVSPLDYRRSAADISNNIKQLYFTFML